MSLAGAEAGALRRAVVIVNQRGLHARAAAKFVRMVGQFDAAVSVDNGSDEVSGLSIMGLMMLAASPGTELVLKATGRQATDVLEALSRLVAERFGEDE